jgi:pimeloyl-ACP methyl ester carboxylesterase
VEYTFSGGYAKNPTLGLLPFLIAPQRVSRPSRLALLAAVQSVTPASAAWRLSLLSQFTLEELPLERIEKPALVLAAGADRLLPSEAEAERLVSYLPNAQKTILPESGHACLLETEVKLSDILQFSSGRFPAALRREILDCNLNHRSGSKTIRHTPPASGRDS